MTGNPCAFLAAAPGWVLGEGKSPGQRVPEPHRRRAGSVPWLQSPGSQGHAAPTGGLKRPFPPASPELGAASFSPLHITLKVPVSASLFTVLCFLLILVCGLRLSVAELWVFFLLTYMPFHLLKKLTDWFREQF